MAPRIERVLLLLPEYHCTTIDIRPNSGYIRCTFLLRLFLSARSLVLCNAKHSQALGDGGDELVQVLRF